VLPLTHTSRSPLNDLTSSGRPNRYHQGMRKHPRPTPHKKACATCGHGTAIHHPEQGRRGKKKRSPCCFRVATVRTSSRRERAKKLGKVPRGRLNTVPFCCPTVSSFGTLLGHSFFLLTLFILYYFSLGNLSLSHISRVCGLDSGTLPRNTPCICSDSRHLTWHYHNGKSVTYPGG